MGIYIVDGNWDYNTGEVIIRGRDGQAMVTSVPGLGWQVRLEETVANK